ncbi:MAG: FAD binding domain-containing protein, partial [Saprospiraceae bacterium]|nr:FAD binding domain-containing protein [Saprospiraceae bacterium]
MLTFILNDLLIETNHPSGGTVLDFIRYHKRMTGTKIGCREGDCGACTLLVGDFENDELVYRSMTSCLMPLGNAEGKHIVSIEGINMDQLSPVQQCMVDSNGTQCGFCTPGFIMSLTGFVMKPNSGTCKEAIASIDGNICRCTGYKSIEKATYNIVEAISAKPAVNGINWLVEHRFIPEYFLNIEKRLLGLRKKTTPQKKARTYNMVVGGGTDLLVQKPQLIKQATIRHLFDDSLLLKIYLKNGNCYVGASVSVTSFAESGIIQSLFSDLPRIIKLVSSTPIRNMATLAGNLVNASPIGDMTVFFLALNADIVLNLKGKRRNIKLKDFYLGYKLMDKAS